MVYKIADFYFDIKKLRGDTAYIAQSYLCDDYPRIDALIFATEKNVEYEKEMAVKYNEPAVSDAQYESLAMYRKICAYALEQDAFLMHGAVIEYEGRGYAFLATSGTGKTTHIRQWKEAFGDDKVTIINGDKPILRFLDGKVYAYGTPWNGKEHYGTNGRVELSGICFVNRAEKNSIRLLTPEEAVPLLFSQIMIVDSSNLARQLELADMLVQKVHMYSLNCNISHEAAKVAYHGMNDSAQ